MSETTNQKRPLTRSDIRGAIWEAIKWRGEETTLQAVAVDATRVLRLTWPETRFTDIDAELLGMLRDLGSLRPPAFDQAATGESLDDSGTSRQVDTP